MFSPLEQFKIWLNFPIYYYIFDFSITNFFFNIFFVFIFISGFVFVFINNYKVINVNFVQFIFEGFYKFIYDILIKQAGNKSKVIISFCVNLFFVIFMCNLFGLFIVGFTVTSQIIITVCLAFSVNFGLLILAFYLHKFKFFLFFVPKNIPVFLVPFMVLIEIFSYLIRTVSLSVRLFANMLAGHILLHIFCSFFLLFCFSYNYFASIFVLALLIVIFILEIVIAFLQSYVFLVLFCIYLNDALNMHLVFIFYLNVERYFLNIFWMYNHSIFVVCGFLLVIQV